MGFYSFVSILFMRYARQDEIPEIEFYMKLCAEEAINSKCKKSQRGVMIVKDDEAIGKGYNEPTIPELCCLRDNIKDNSRVELCTGLHAEENAILNALKTGISLAGARMYHERVKDGKVTTVGDIPSCTVCSRLVLKSGISEFVLRHKRGYAIFGAEEFNRMSFDYFLKK